MRNGTIMMGGTDLSTLLEQCIQELQSGSNLEEIMARNQTFAHELRPLLEMAAWTKIAGDAVQVPVGPQSFSRNAFTSSQAARLRQPAPHGFRLRPALSIAAIFICLIFGLIGTTIASAQSLPGDTLYPVKLAWEQAQMSLASGAAQRLLLQATFDQNRVAEVSKLLTLGRTTNVTFSGLLAGSNNSWNVAGININVPDQQTSKLPDLQNTVVKVSGQTEGKKVKVDDIEPRLVTIKGQVQELNSDHLQVAGVNVALDQSTEVVGEVSVNQQVQITAKESENGELVAVAINVNSTASPTPTKTAQPTVEETKGSQKSGPPEKTPKPAEQNITPAPSEGIQPTMTEQDSTPTPPEGIQPMVIGPTTAPAAAGSENEAGNRGQLPTPTPVPGNTNLSGDGGESRPALAPTPTPSSETGYPTQISEPPDG